MSKIPAKRSSTPPPKVVYRTRQVTTGPQQRHSLNPGFKIGDRVLNNGKAGTIAFIGSTKFAEGEWVGVNLDEPTGKNDGALDGIRYFETDANHGLFCRPDKIQRLSINGAPQRKSLNDLLRQSIIEEAPVVRTVNRKDSSFSTKNLQKGDRVIINGTKLGTLQYIGKTHIDDDVWCGVRLDGPLGKHDGKLKGVRYYQCPPLFGLFARLRDVENVSSNPVDVRQSFVSNGSVNQDQDSPSQDSNHSELSNSSNSHNLFPSRSPKKTRQPSTSTDLTLIETSLSNQIAQLRETIREKDLLIEKLEQQTEKVRLEDSQMTEKIRQMETHITQLQHRYETTENENFDLIKEQMELKQRLDELPDQLLIPDDHRLVSLEDIQRYEQYEEKVRELESINQQLTQDYQSNDNQTTTFDDQYLHEIESLKLQITDLQNREQLFKTQLAAKETFYQQQSEEYQTKITQLTKVDADIRSQLNAFEEEKQFNDRRINDILHELKQYEENIVPTLEQQCQGLELKLQNQTSNERELFYEQQIKEYQANIHQAARETEMIRTELKQMQEKNGLEEKKASQVIQELKENYEKVQLELNAQEQQVDNTVHQSQSQYDAQIQEYETNLNRATDATEQIQAELTKLGEEKAQHDEKTNNLISSLKEEYEAQYEVLKNQLDELQNRDDTESRILNERLVHYETKVQEYQLKIEQDAKQIQNVRDELKSLQEEKLSQEEEFKQGYHELQREVDELNERERQAHKTLQQHDVQFDQRLTEYERKLEQANGEIQNLQSELQAEKANSDATLTEYKSQADQSLLEIEHLRSQLTNLEAEKSTMENQLNETINTFEQKLQMYQQEFEERMKEYQVTLEQHKSESESLREEKVQFNETTASLAQELQALKTELQEQDHAHQTVLNDLEVHYQSQLVNFEDEKRTLKEQINVLQQAHEKLQGEQEQKEKRMQKECRVQFEQEIDEYQKNLELSLQQTTDVRLELVNLQEEKESNEKRFNQAIASLKSGFEREKIELQKQNDAQEERLKEYESTIEQSNDLFEQIEDLTHMNKQLNDELEDLKSQMDPKEVEQLTQQVADLQEMHLNLLEKQAVKEQAYAGQKKAHEESLQEKSNDFELKIALMKSEYMVEMENSRLVHDQEVLRLKALIPKKGNK